ncbi:MAG: YfdX family protein [Aestuariibacter sp.]|nr:YfdX family protein [Aestuariibacter sp.]MCP4237325.1 YfdX family protein [Aestuariibacter sp.]|tara:strand:+ start:10560 stop:11456 length:897 start_codon:yes stop_codon:yes gene_type:complete
MKSVMIQKLLSIMTCLCLMASAPTWADLTKPETQSQTAQAVQDDVNAQTDDQAESKRKKITADAIAAVQETKNALKLLDENKIDEALAALEQVTGKLELIIARDPTLSLAPIDVAMATYDLLAQPNTVKTLVKRAEDLLEDYDVQAARKLLKSLASEVVISTTSIPLATYPDTIKAIAPLIDAGKVDEAKGALQMALNTLVVSDTVIPLPLLRAETLLADAEELSEKADRTESDNKKLASLFEEIKTQLEMAELLGYATNKEMKAINEELKNIEKKSEGQQSGEGWYDKIKEKVSDLF